MNTFQGYGLTGIMEMWWDGCYYSSVEMEVYRPFRKETQGRWGGVAFNVNDQLECMELHLGMNDKPTESLGARINETAGTGDNIIEVHHTLPD